MPNLLDEDRHAARQVLINRVNYEALSQGASVVLLDSSEVNSASQLADLGNLVSDSGDLSVMDYDAVIFGGNPFTSLMVDQIGRQAPEQIENQLPESVPLLSANFHTRPGDWRLRRYEVIENRGCWFDTGRSCHRQ